MLEHSENLHVPGGTYLFSQGDRGDLAYLIQSGEIEVYIRRDGADVVVARRGAGEIVGEMALIDGRTRSASARVSIDSVLVPITAQQIEHRIAETDPILRMCLGVVIERLRETLTLAPMPSRPAAAPIAVHRPVGADFSSVLETLTLEREIERALLQDEFELYLQPIVHLSSGSLKGFEALIRWNHPRRGLVMPGNFIGIAESSGLIVGITLWCLREVTRIFPLLAAAALRAMARAGAPSILAADLFVSVNISGHDLVQPAFAETVQSILLNSGLPASSLKLEVTESMLMKDPQSARMILESCRMGGMGVAVDDFGTGYSNLSYLSTLPITTLKIDRAFVRSIAVDQTSRKIVSTIRHLARELGIDVVAEGIETEAQADALKAMDCDYGQGFLYARPLPLRAALDLIGTWSHGQVGVQPLQRSG